MTKKKRKRTQFAPHGRIGRIKPFNGHKGAPIVVTLTIGTADALPQITAAKQLAVMQFERAYLNEVMTRAGGSLSVAARVAGFDRSNLRRRLEAHGIDPNSFAQKTLWIDPA